MAQEKGARHKSAVKRARQNIKKRERNNRIISTVRTAIKGVTAAVKSKDNEDAARTLKKAIPLIDKAVSKGVLHKNTASRKVSRLQRLVNTVSA